jgi:hypothetical protein
MLGNIPNALETVKSRVTPCILVCGENTSRSTM